MPETVAPQPNSSPRPIVVAVDGSPTSYRAVAWAAVEAELRRLPLEIVIAYGVEPSREPWTALGVAERAAVHAEAASVPAEATRIARHTVPGETVSVTGAAVDEPVLSALVARSATARMMVVGDRGRGAIRRAVLGSVSSGLARRAECPYPRRARRAGCRARCRRTGGGRGGRHREQPARRAHGVRGGVAAQGAADRRARLERQQRVRSRGARLGRDPRARGSAVVGVACRLR
ncbi:hypothetical protein GL307_21955 [Nocardia seriolae]|nr:hypothetical protein [Nocardia seriolae]